LEIKIDKDRVVRSGTMHIPDFMKICRLSQKILKGNRHTDMLS